MGLKVIVLMISLIHVFSYDVDTTLNTLTYIENGDYVLEGC